MRGVEEMWDSAGGRERGKGSNEAGEMYVWLPISNIYEERALRRGGQGKGKRGGQKGYSVMPALKNGKTRGGRDGRERSLGRRQVYMSNLHFQYFLLGRKHQLSSQSAALWNGIARLREDRERSERFLYYLPNPLSQ